MILALVERVGLRPKRESTTSGGEYGCACPNCGGNDRFRIWPMKGHSGRFWCRRCNLKGDSITFARHFLGMSFIEARDFVGISDRSYHFSPNIAEISPIRSPTRCWISKAEKFVEISHRHLMIDSNALSFLKEKYGLIQDTIRNFRIGWNPEQRFDRRSEWGLSESGKKLCLPKGIVIPAFHGKMLSKIKIRRADWIEGDRFPKYWEISGSSNRISTYGFFINQVVLVIESELDAMTLCQEIGEFCTCIATGGANKRPDVEISRWLQSRRLILYSQDYDPAGCENWRWWHSTFENVRVWPSETRKNPVDSFVLDGVNLKAWFEAGVKIYR